MVAGLIGIILFNALGFFWPADVVRAHARGRQGADGPGRGARARCRARPAQYRIKLKVANRDLYGADFVWVDEAQIAAPRVCPPTSP